MSIPGKKKSYVKKIFLVFAILHFICSCKLNSDSTADKFYLDSWEYSVNDGLTFSCINVHEISRLHDYVPSKKGYIILQSRFNIPENLRGERLSLCTGKMLIASKIYVNGKQIGQRGVFPPREFYSGNASSCFEICKEDLNLAGENVVQIKFYVNGVGGIFGKPYITEYENAETSVKFTSFINSEIYLIFFTILFFVSVTYFLVFMQNRDENQYLYFAIVNFFSSLYLFPFLVSELPHLSIMMNYLMFNKIFRSVVGLVIAYYAASFMIDFLDYPQSKNVFIIRLVLLFISCTICMCIPDMVVYVQCTGYVFALILLQVSFGINALIHSFKSNRRQAITLNIGFVPVLICIACDVIIKYGLKNETVPYVTVYGWVLSIVFFLMILIHQYGTIKKRVEYLNLKLEDEVADRTKKLKKSNAELEYINTQAARDMELAVNIQKAFYPQNTDFKGWDVAIMFKPLSGVSGDLYDFYYGSNLLKGFGVFDVSGHGISSGLVTMLAKNCIFNIFNSFSSQSLAQVMNRVNTEIISTKGRIENYLTGTLFRIDKNDQTKLEMVNAGNPYPIISRNGRAEFLKQSDNQRQCGMLGIAGIEVHFAEVNFCVNENDFIVAYTDGLTESENVEGKQFGKEGMLKAVEKIGNSKECTAQDILNSIMKDFNSFTEKVPLDDDLTLIVLKKIQAGSKSEFYSREELEEL